MSKLYSLFAILGIERLAWKASGDSRLRILAYHGVCDDHISSEAWVPKHFVATAVFEEQVRYLCENASIMHLAEAVERLRAGSLPRRAVVLTFDDGYANNLYKVLPILEKYRAPATVFISTAYVERALLFPFDRLRLIKIEKQGDHAVLQSLVEYKSHSLDAVTRAIEASWSSVASKLTRDQIEALRPLTLDELKRLNDHDLITIGAHSHWHCILGNETRERRAQEITQSVNLVRQWTGLQECPFSYPNGQRNDYDEEDMRVLRSLNVRTAVSGIAGINGATSDPLDLKRLPVGIYHVGHSFAAEVVGFRNLVRSATLSR